MEDLNTRSKKSLYSRGGDKIYGTVQQHEFFIRDWERITARLKNSGKDLSKIKLVIKKDSRGWKYTG